MRHVVFSILAVITLTPEVSRAQLTAKRVVKFVIPEANALAEVYLTNFWKRTAK
jgi:hypothetical protein